MLLSISKRSRNWKFVSERRGWSCGWKTCSCSTSWFNTNAPGEEQYVVNASSFIFPGFSALWFFYFLEIEIGTEEQHLVDLEGIRLKMTAYLWSIPKSDFKRCYDDWLLRLWKCIVTQGEYFEGDKINLWYTNVNVFFVHWSRTFWTNCVTKNIKTVLWIAFYYLPFNFLNNNAYYQNIMKTYFIQNFMTSK